MLEHIKATLLAGYRSRSFQVLAVLAVCMVGASVLAGEFSGREPQTVMLDVGISGMRIVGLMMVLFWCQDLIGRDIDRRTVLLTLAYPQPRHSYLIGRFVGITLLSLITLTLLAGLAMLVAHGGIFNDYSQSVPPRFDRLPLVVLMLWLELVVVTAFTVLVSALSTTPFLPLAMGAAFAIAARTLGPVMGYLSRKDALATIKAQSASTISAIKWFLPDLDRLDIRTTALYGIPVSSQEIWVPAFQAVSYAGLLLILATWVFSRRQFES
jgi:ABC-type transport system involved in multi-copper enzyme maturation permease subunit